MEWMKALQVGLALLACVASVTSPSNEITCSAPAKYLDIHMSPPEIKTRTSKQDVEESRNGSLTLKGRYLDPAINPTCTFSPKAKKRAHRIRKNLAKGQDENVVLQCSVSGMKKSQIHWNNIRNAAVENKTTTNGNITTTTSYATLPRSSLSPNQSVSCNILDTTNGNPVNIFAVVLVVVVVAVVVAVAVVGFCIFKKRKRASQKSEDKNHQEDGEGTSFTGMCENRDETPTKDVGSENEDLQTKAKSYTPRKLFD